MTNIVPVEQVLQWMPSGPVLGEFIRSPYPVTGIMGPYGSGKTIGSFVKGLLCSTAVPRSPVDGVRYARGAVVRDTYRNLQFNTIPSWEERFPRDLGSWKGGTGGEPGQATLDLKLDDGSILHLEILFVAVGDHNVKSFCDGLQVNWCFGNGGDALPPDFIPYMGTRLGRWPPPQHRPVDWKLHGWKWRKLWVDFNAPEIDNHLHGDIDKKQPGFVENVPKGWKLYVQPGGMDPNAENLANLLPDYYTSMVENNAPWFVNRFVHNKWGFSRAGEAVYPEYDDTRHPRKKMKFNPKRTLYIAMDGGRDACAVAGQRRPSGGLDLLKEFVPVDRMGAKEFGKALGIWLGREFPDAEEIEFFADPAVVNPNDIDEQTWCEIVAAELGQRVAPAPSNDLEPRLESVRQPLTETDNVGEPMLRLDPDECPTIRRGFNSGYRYGTQKTHGDEVSTVVPIKNKFSHPLNAVEYLALSTGDYSFRVGRARRRKGPKLESMSMDPFG